MKRLFFALWPDDSVRNACVKIMHDLTNGKGKPIDPDNLHITLLFLGNVKSDKAILLTKEASLLPVPKINLTFNQLSYWKKAGILCLTTTQVDQGLLTLVDNIAAIAQKLEIAFDQRSVIPHVTLFRKVDAIEGYDFESIAWHSSSFRLVESHYQMQQVEYRTIASWDAH